MLLPLARWSRNHGAGARRAVVASTFIFPEQQTLVTILVEYTSRTALLIHVALDTAVLGRFAVANVKSTIVVGSLVVDVDDVLAL